MRNTPAFIPTSKTPCKLPQNKGTTVDRRATFCMPKVSGNFSFFICTFMRNSYILCVEFLNVECFSVTIGQLNPGRKSLPVYTVTQKSRASANPSETKLVRDTFDGRKSLSAISNVRQSQPLFIGRKSLSATGPAKNGTKLSHAAKLAARATNAKPDKITTSNNQIQPKVTSSVKRPTNVRNSFPATAKAANKKEPFTGRKSLLPPSTLNNSKPSRPLKSTTNTTSLKPVPRVQNVHKKMTQFNTQKSGATKNTHNLQTINFKSGANSLKKTTGKPRRSILKPHTEEKSNFQMDATILEESADESNDVSNKENTAKGRIEIIKQTSKSVHFISPCTTPRMKTPGMGIPIKTPTKEPSMR